MGWFFWGAVYILEGVCVRDKISFLLDLLKVVFLSRNKLILKDSENKFNEGSVSQRVEVTK